MADNKVMFGISKAYYAKWTPGTGETAGTYAAPVAMPGAVSLTINVEGDETTKYADNIPWFTQAGNSGYSGELTLTTVPDSVRTDLLGETIGGNGIVYETTDDVQHEFALLFEVEGDQKGRRYAFYNCTLSRIEFEANTKEDTIETDDQTLNIRMIARQTKIGNTDVNIVKGFCNEGDTAYDGWYTAVTLPTAQG